MAFRGCSTLQAPARESRPARGSWLGASRPAYSGAALPVRGLVDGDLLCEDLASYEILMCFDKRPSFHSSFVGYPQVAQVQLNPIPIIGPRILAVHNAVLADRVRCVLATEHWRAISSAV